jgi:D-alanine-D-alanine ligase
MVGQTKQFGRIGVLMGGPSSERDISLKSGHAVFDVLSKLALDVVSIDITTDNPEENTRLINSHNINCAFLALHGRFGEDGQIQKILDDLSLAYTGSGAKASQLAMDKIASRKIFQARGLAVPEYRVLEKATYTPEWKDKFNLTFPLVVKPATNGSSIGLTIVDRKEEFGEALDLAFSYDDRIIVENYIAGREITVGILDEQPLPVIEIVPKKRFFDYEAKYKTGMTDYLVPAQLDQAVARLAQDIALVAHKSLGCSGCSRADMILNKENIPFVLEINTIPGLTATSLLPKAARVVGIDFGELCLKLISLAYEKKKP